MQDATKIPNSQESHTPPMSPGGTVLLVGNYESDVGYAWWLMENFWAVIASQMARQSRRCILAYPKVTSIPNIIRDSTAEVIEARIRPRSLAHAMRTALLLRRLGVRSVYLSDWPSFSYVYVLWRLFGVRRIVLHYHTFSEGKNPKGLRALLKSAMHRSRLISCDHYVGVSDYIHRRFIDNWKVPAARCVAVKNGITVFGCNTIDRSAVRRTLPVPEDAVVVTLVGRASVHKGWDFSLRCLRTLQLEELAGRSVHFVYCGDGPDLGHFKQCASALGVEPFAHFLGRREDVRRILCASDMAFHPSHGEAMSLAILEFLCASLPVVVPNIRSVCQSVTHGETGLIYDANNEAEAVLAIGTLVRDSAMRHTMGRAARASVLSTHRLEQTNEAFIRKVIPVL